MQENQESMETLLTLSVSVQLTNVDIFIMRIVLSQKIAIYAIDLGLVSAFFYCLHAGCRRHRKILAFFMTVHATEGKKIQLARKDECKFIINRMQ